MQDAIITGEPGTGKTQHTIRALQATGKPVEAVSIHACDDAGRRIVSTLPLADYLCAAAAKPDQYPEVDQRAITYIPINEMFNQEPVELHEHDDWMYWCPIRGRRRGHTGELERPEDPQPLGARLRSFIFSL